MSAMTGRDGHDGHHGDDGGRGKDGARPLERLSALGQSIWIDYLSRQMIRGGHLRQLIAEDSVVGATSNPTIFQEAMSEGDAYDEEIHELAERTEDPEEVFWSLAERDIAEACEVFAETWEATGGRDGYVSIEVAPGLAYDTLPSFREAMRLHEAIDKRNLLVKIPGTKPGLAAIEDVIAKGRSINVTLIFSLRRYEEVAECYLRGLERLVAEGGDPGKVASVASFFVSRIDTEADRRLDEIGGHEGLKGKLAIANATLAYQRYTEIFSGPRWEFLRGKGARTQRLLWASTSTKNPAYPDTMYVDGLISPDTVNTMPEKTLLAYQDHGDPRPPEEPERRVEQARAVFDELERAGVDYDDLTDTLEREGVAKFAQSFQEAVESLRGKVGALAAA